MKQKLSVSVDKEKVKLIEKYVEDGVFRNKSHAVEKGLDSLLNTLEEQNDKQ